MTLKVRDEADIIADNLRFHRAMGVDFFVVTDNGSVDGTSEVLDRYRSAGLAHVIQEPTSGLRSNEMDWTTRMARLAASEYGADWVFNNDADEFWWPRTGSLRSVFEGLGADVGTVVGHRTNFVPRPEDGRPYWERMTLRERESLNPVGKPLPPKLAHRAHPEIVVVQGNHRIKGPDLGSELDDGSIEILHFPMRSYAQFENKIAKGGRAYARNKELPEKTGRTWRRLYETWEQGGLPGHYQENVVAESTRDDLIEDTRLRDYLEARRLAASAGE